MLDNDKVAEEAGRSRNCNFNPKPEMTPNLKQNELRQAEAQGDENEGLEGTPGPKAGDTEEVQMQQGDTCSYALSYCI